MKVIRPLLLEIAREIWTHMLRMDLQESELAEAESGDGDQYFVGSVQILGQRELSVTLQLPLPLAQQVTAAMLEVELSDITEALTLDAVGELTNLVGGTLQNKIPGRNRLSVPTVVKGEASAALPPNLLKLFEIPCRSQSPTREHLPTLITVHERLPA